MESGLISNIQRSSLHDGPGIRTTIFLKGCPLRCLWCHNPENLDPQPKVRFIANRCIACGQCVEKCPYGDEPEGRRTEKCSTCGVCVSICPTAARQIVGRPMTVADLTAEVERDLLFFEESRGGVTFSGGEPVCLPVGKHLDATKLHAALDSPDTPDKDRLAAASNLAWLNRCQEGKPLELSCLRLGPVMILHMPGELFVEYQLAAQRDTRRRRSLPGGLRRLRAGLYRHCGGLSAGRI